MGYEYIPDAELTEIIYTALRARFNDYNHWLYAREVPVKTGYAETRIDAVTMDCYESENYRIDGYEVKASQADLKKELLNPNKHKKTYECVDYFWLVTAPRVIKGIYDDLPKKWGVLVLKDDGSLRVRRQALDLEDRIDSNTSRDFIASFMRRAVFQDRSDEKLTQIREEAYESGRQSILRLNESLNHVSDLVDTIHAVEDELGIYRGNSKDDIVTEIKKLKERAISDPKWILSKLDTIQRDAKELDRYVKEFKKAMPINADGRRWY